MRYLTLLQESGNPIFTFQGEQIIPIVAHPIMTPRSSCTHRKKSIQSNQQALEAERSQRKANSKALNELTIQPTVFSLENAITESLNI